MLGCWDRSRQQQQRYSCSRACNACVHVQCCAVLRAGPPPPCDTRRRPAAPCGVLKNAEHAKDTGRLVVEKTFTLPVAFPEVAVLLVLLKDADVGGTTDSVLGYSSLPLASLAPGEYMLRLTKPYVLPRKEHEHMHVTSMWVKLKLEWLAGAAAAEAEQAQGGGAAAAT